MGGDRKVLAFHLGEDEVEFVTWGASTSASAAKDVVQHSFMPKAFDQALREALQADHVQVERADAAPPRPRDPLMLSIPAESGGQPATVHIRRQGSPFDERDERVARQIVGLMGDVMSACTTSGDRATVFVEDTLEQLDLMGSHSVEERLALVARNACHWFEGAGWLIGVLDGQTLVTLVDEVSHRPGSPARASLLAERTPIASQAVLGAFEGGSFVVTAACEDTLGLALRRHRLRTMVAAGGYDVDAIQWLVAVMEGEHSHDLLVARSALSATVQAALGFPRPPRSYGERLNLGAPSPRG